MSINVGRYVGLRRGEYWERTENSDYYCGGCGWKVTDHDSYCPECGGALHKAAPGRDTCKVDVLVSENAKLLETGENWMGKAVRLESENAKLLESVRNLLTCIKHEECEESCPYYSPAYNSYGRERGGSIVVEDEYLGCCTVGLENCNSMFFDTDEYLRELGIEAK